MAGDVWCHELPTAGPSRYGEAAVFIISAEDLGMPCRGGEETADQGIPPRLLDLHVPPFYIYAPDRTILARRRIIERIAIP